MSKENNIHIYILVAILIIMIAVIAYLMFLRRESPLSSGNGGSGNGGFDPDPDTPPGFMTLKYDNTQNEKSRTWELGGEYNATLFTGVVKAEGSMYVNVRTYVRTKGGWKHLATDGGWSGSFFQLQNAVTINMRIDAMKFEAEQGILPGRTRRIDEIHAQLTVEIP